MFITFLHSLHSPKALAIALGFYLVYLVWQRRDLLYHKLRIRVRKYQVFTRRNPIRRVFFHIWVFLAIYFSFYLSW